MLEILATLALVLSRTPRGLFKALLFFFRRFAMLSIISFTMNSKQQLAKAYHCVFLLHYHLVLVTKYRKWCITREMASFLEAQCRRLLSGLECELLEFNGEPDHVHLLFSATPSAHPVRLVNSLKTVTSRLARRQFAGHLSRYYWKPVFWSRSYCLITCGGAPLSVLKQYIEQQDGFD